MLDHRTPPLEIRDLPWQLSLGLVFVDEKPTLFALYRRRSEGGAAGSVVAWVVALPDGAAVLLPADGHDIHPMFTTLVNVRNRWARLMRAELVQVAGRDALHMAA